VALSNGASSPQAFTIDARMADATPTDTIDRIAQAMWALLNEHPEIGYLSAEVILAEGAEPEVLATDVAGGVLWIDRANADMNRQVVLPNGQSARYWRN
jgi:hypothetical protein